MLSILTKSALRRQLTKQSLVIQTANATTIATVGTESYSLNLSIRRSFKWDFTIADIYTAILGADILSLHGLYFDLQGRHLLDGLTNLATVCTLGPLPEVYSLSAAKPYTDGEGPISRIYEKLITIFAQTNTEPSLMSSLPVQLIQHEISNLSY